MYRLTSTLLTKISLKNYPKKRLIFLTNLVILIASFAVTASVVSLFYERKIVELNKNLSTELGNEVIYNHWLAEIPKNVRNIENIIDQISKENNYLVYLNKINKRLITYRDLAHNPINNLVRFNRLNIEYLLSSINDAILISRNPDDIKKIINDKKIFIDIDKKFTDLYRENKLGVIVYNPGKLETYSELEKEKIYKDSLLLIDDLIEILRTIKLLYIKNILKYFSESKSESLKKISNLKQEIKEISLKESNTILFAFLIQVIIFFIIQFFEFGFELSQVNRRKNAKRN